MRERRGRAHDHAVSCASVYTTVSECSRCVRAHRPMPREAHPACAAAKRQVGVGIASDVCVCAHASHLLRRRDATTGIDDHEADIRELAASPVRAARGGVGHSAQVDEGEVVQRVGGRSHWRRAARVPHRVLQRRGTRQVALDESLDRAVVAAQNARGRLEAACDVCLASGTRTKRDVPQASACAFAQVLNTRRTERNACGR